MSQLPVKTGGRRPTRSVVVWVVVALVAALAVCAAWVTVRAFAAKADLEASIGLVGQLKTEIAHGDTAHAASLSARLASKAHSAQRLTSDPIWRGAELVPFVGPNLRAVRGVASIVSDVSDHAIRPLATTVGSLGPDLFSPADGSVSLKPLTAAGPVVTRADAAVRDGLTRARALESEKTIGPVHTAVTRLASELHSAGETTDAVARAVRLLPSMLGENGPRDYLLMFQNNAELRATGGIPGALALVHVDKGAMTLIRQAAAVDFVSTRAPALAVPPATAKLYGTMTGEFMQDVNLTPRFDISADLAAKMWQRRYGQKVDGVLSVDPVALGAMLAATGPVRLPDGERLTSANAVSTLLSTTYSRFPVPADQDRFFAAAAAAIFSKISSGSFDSGAMIRAFATAGSTHRLLIWSSHADEQYQLAQTSLAGLLPSGDAAERHLGVYLNDATGAKMDYYLHATVGVGSATCRHDGRANYAVDVTLRNAAPVNAATALSAYVTGVGHSGVPAGTVRTNVVVYAPRGATVLGVQSGGAAIPSSASDDGEYSVRIVQVELKPGQAKTVRLQFLAAKGAGAPEVAATPGANATQTNVIDFGCAAALK